MNVFNEFISFNDIEIIEREVNGKVGKIGKLNSGMYTIEHFINHLN